MKFTIVLAAALLFTTSLSAQVLQNEKPYIEVAGTAEKEVIPDEIYISIALTERYDGRNKITIEEQERQLKDIVKKLGIDMANLSVSNAEASYVRINWLNKDVIARKNYSLKVADAETISRVFQELENINIKGASIAKVDYAKREELKKELRITAVKAAKAKAEYMLEAIGQTIGKPLYVHENEIIPYNTFNVRMEKMANTSTQDAAPSDDYLEFKKIKFTTTVEAKFEIK